MLRMNLTQQIHDVVHAGSSENVLVLVIRDPSPEAINSAVLFARAEMHKHFSEHETPGPVTLLTTQDDPTRDWYIGQPGALCSDCP